MPDLKYNFNDNRVHHNQLSPLIELRIYIHCQLNLSLNEKRSARQRVLLTENNQRVFSDNSTVMLKKLTDCYKALETASMNHQNITINYYTFFFPNLFTQCVHHRSPCASCYHDNETITYYNQLITINEYTSRPFLPIVIVMFFALNIYLLKSSATALAVKDGFMTILFSVQGNVS